MTNRVRARATIAVAAFAAAAVLALACGGGDGSSAGAINGPDLSGPMPAASISCGATKSIFTVPPVALTDFFGWVPLGNLGPPGHTFPTDHQYIYVNDPGTSAQRREVNLIAPATMYITRGRQGTQGGVTDYTLEFSPCAEVYGQFGHVLSIAPAILSALGAFDQYCNSYFPVPNSQASTCETRPASIKVSAGDVIGTAGGAAPHSLGLDFSLWDARVPPIIYANPVHWPANNSKFDNFHVVPATDYFAEPAASQIAPRIGSFDGKIRRTIAPVGGTIQADISGAAMGFWFNASQPTYPESPHLAIAPDNVDPTQISFSIGTSLPNWTRGLVRFTPVATGLVNRDPATITANGTTYCFESPGAWVLLVKMLDAGTLRLEGEPQAIPTCAAAQPWTFTSAAFDYRR